MTERSEEQRFSQAYGHKGEPESDSPRMRTRLAALVAARLSFDQRELLGEAVEQEQGVSMSQYYGYGYNWNKFLQEAELRDVLDLVSTVVGVIGHPAESWIKDVRRIFSEEHVRYYVTDLGGVRFAIDEAFERGNVATIAALGSPRYATTLRAFESALNSLADIPPRGKDAIRDIFSTVEGLFRLMFPKAPRLGAREIDNNLKPLIEGLFASDVTASRASVKILNSFKEWVDAAHFYRHEPNHAEPNKPPLQLAVLLVSEGANWIRWLAELDQSTAH